ncbi:hypothetical protein HMPREF9413_5108 [Paenibacillus sp. HGF7]|nr:hypothetical protein HMPREF9413_5108 [Paenibacillus sp. HGF7]
MPRHVRDSAGLTMDLWETVSLRLFLFSIEPGEVRVFFYKIFKV